MNNKELTSTKPSNQQVASDGINCVMAELKMRGADAEAIVDKRRTFLKVSKSGDNRTIQIRVKTKRGKTNWHSNISEAKAIDNLPKPEDETLFWVFVNLNDYKTPPRFWIVPDSWMRNDIYTAHEEYLARYGGRRAENDESDHHSINEKRLTEWEGKWEVLGIF